MRLGIGSYTFAWAVGIPEQMPERPMTARGLLDKARALEVSVVQIADNMSLHELPVSEIEALQEGATDLVIELGCRGIHPDHLDTYVRLAELLGSRVLRVVVDTDDHHPPEDEIVSSLREFVPHLEKASVVLAIENHDRFRASALARIIERIGSDHVGVCLDTVNSFGALEGPQVVVDALVPYVVNLHVKDFVVERASHLKGFSIEGRPAGQGQLDIPWLLGRLNDQGINVNAILELWVSPETTLAETIAKEDAWAVDSVAYLRRFIAD